MLSDIKKFIDYKYTLNKEKIQKFIYNSTKYVLSDTYFYFLYLKIKLIFFEKIMKSIL